MIPAQVGIILLVLLALSAALAGVWLIPALLRSLRGIREATDRRGFLTLLIIVLLVVAALVILGLALGQSGPETTGPEFPPLTPGH